VGFAIGPALGGLIVDGLGWSISAVFAVSALLSIGTALLVTFGSREVRPTVVPEGPVLSLAFGAVKGVLGDPVVRRIFAIFGLAFLATQMTRPYIPVLVEGIVGIGPGLASSIALVAGTAALVGALISPLGGALGDRIGFRTVLIAALVGGAVALLIMPNASTIPVLAAAAVLLGMSTAAVSAMIFGLLATEVPPERRSATLNLVYLPLYLAGTLGPALAGVVVTVIGVSAPFILGALVFAFGAMAIVALAPRRGDQGVSSVV
jgi:predicted MFS family arabinose efflux permease